MERRKIIYIIIGLIIIISIAASVLVATVLWRSGYRPFMDCSNPPATNPFTSGEEKHKGFEAAKNLDYCGGYTEDFKAGCEEYLKQQHLYFRNCVEK